MAILTEERMKKLDEAIKQFKVTSKLDTEILDYIFDFMNCSYKTYKTSKFFHDKVLKYDFKLLEIDKRLSDLEKLVRLESTKKDDK